MSNIRELFVELQNKLNPELEENQIACPKCKGLRLTLTIKENGNAFVTNCCNCHTGVVYECKYCKCLSKSNHCMCEASQNERHERLRTEHAECELKKFQKATKIDYNDYNGFFIVDDFAKTKEDFENYLYERIKDGYDVPNYAWATEPYVTIEHVDIVEIITDLANDNGYEDMASYLDLDSDLLFEAQNLIDKWVEKNKEALKYYEEINKVVMLDDIIDKFKKEIKA